MLNLYPLVSCICITEGRPTHLLRSIKLFIQQAYPNKELVISICTEDMVTTQLIDRIVKFGLLKLTIVQRRAEDTYGQACNAAIKNCKGEYVCIWDDDDISDPTRILEQMDALLYGNRRLAASILTRLIIYDLTPEKAYVSYPAFWGCTLLCNISQLQDDPCLDTDENVLITVINRLDQDRQLVQISTKPFLYTFLYHGNNVMDYVTFLYIINQSQALDRSISKQIKAFLTSSSSDVLT